MNRNLKVESQDGFPSAVTYQTSVAEIPLHTKQLMKQLQFHYVYPIECRSKQIKPRQHRNLVISIVLIYFFIVTIVPPPGMTVRIQR